MTVMLASMTVTGESWSQESGRIPRFFVETWRRVRQRCIRHCTPRSQVCQWQTGLLMSTSHRESLE